jgi:hypothetical protein
MTTQFVTLEALEWSSKWMNEMQGKVDNDKSILESIIAYTEKNEQSNDRIIRKEDLQD